jgi:hypothetical protein
MALLVPRAPPGATPGPASNAFVFWRSRTNRFEELNNYSGRMTRLFRAHSARPNPGSVKALFEGQRPGMLSHGQSSAAAITSGRSRANIFDLA